MTSLDRAKRFLAGKTAKLALAAVPLALAVPAAFGQVTFNTDGTCAFSGSFGGSCAVQSVSPGGNAAANEISLFGNGSTNVGLDFSYSGSASGFLQNTAALPVDWNFSLFNLTTQLPVGGNSVGTSANITLTFTIFENSGSSVSAVENLGTLGIGTYTGSDTLNVAPGFVSGYSIELNGASGSSAYTINIPGGATLDLNGAVSTATPEPSSADLAGAGVAGAFLFGLLRRFRRRTA